MPRHVAHPVGLGLLDGRARIIGRYALFEIGDDGERIEVGGAIVRADRVLAYSGTVRNARSLRDILEGCEHHERASSLGEALRAIRPHLRGFIQDLDLEEPCYALRMHGSGGQACRTEEWSVRAPDLDAAVERAARHVVLFRTPFDKVRCSLAMDGHIQARWTTAYSPRNRAWITRDLAIEMGAVSALQESVVSPGP